MKTTQKVLLVILIALFIYASFGLEFSDLSWENNSKTYKVLLNCIAIFIGMGLDHWFQKRKQQQQ